jgi:hypothetical protein
VIGDRSSGLGPALIALDSGQRGRLREGIVAAVSPLTVYVGGSTVATPATALDSYAPVVGDFIAILADDADRVVLGRIGAGLLPARQEAAIISGAKSIGDVIFGPIDYSAQPFDWRLDARVLMTCPDTTSWEQISIMFDLDGAGWGVGIAECAIRVQSPAVANTASFTGSRAIDVAAGETVSVRVTAGTAMAAVNTDGNFQLLEAVPMSRRA